MKKLVQLLIKIFRLDIPTIKVVEVPVDKIVYKDRIVEKEVYVSLDETINGTCTVKGDLIVNGSLTVTGEIACFKMKGK